MSSKLINAKVISISPLTDSIIQLQLVPDVYMPYQAGQYLNIHCDEQIMSYSIANAPLGSHQYELHVKHTTDTTALFTQIKQQGSVDISLPYGECHIDTLDPQKPIIFLAGGTGFAPIKAMIEQLLFDADTRFFELYWGARSKADLYLEDKLLSWQTHAVHFNYYALSSNNSKETLLSALLAQHGQELHQWQIVLSGPFDMVYSFRDKLVALGVAPEYLFSDAFSFEGK